MKLIFALCLLSIANAASVEQPSHGLPPSVPGETVSGTTSEEKMASLEQMVSYAMGTATGDQSSMKSADVQNVQGAVTGQTIIQGSSTTQTSQTYVGQENSKQAGVVTNTGEQGGECGGAKGKCKKGRKGKGIGKIVRLLAAMRGGEGAKGAKGAKGGNGIWQAVRKLANMKGSGSVP